MIALGAILSTLVSPAVALGSDICSAPDLEQMHEARHVFYATPYPQFTPSQAAQVSEERVRMLQGAFEPGEPVEIRVLQVYAGKAPDTLRGIHEGMRCPLDAVTPYLIAVDDLVEPIRLSIANAAKWTREGVALCCGRKHLDAPDPLASALRCLAVYERSPTTESLD